MPVVWSDRHRMHDPGGEVWVGIRTPGTELPARADRIRARLEEAGAAVVPAREQPRAAAASVHDAGLLEYLEGAWSGWEEAGLTVDPGQDRVVPYLWPLPGLFADGSPARTATARTALAGQFAYDTMTLVGPGTWEGARAALDTAVTAAGLVADGAPAAYACCRPPGHHVTRSCFGGSCYLNNAAAAAARLRGEGFERVAVIDVDAHHGNGTQAIFWDDPSVLTASVHVDPGAGWFPHYLGFEEETGAGANRNLTLVPGTGDERWTAAVGTLAEWAADGGAEALVVALGVDAAGGDPESPLDVTEAGFRAAGRALGALGLPTVVVQEGGYDLDAIGRLVLAALEGLEEGTGG
jgi:acetoin utilization deacetylase AcuC-like enzyme